MSNEQSPGDKVREALTSYFGKAYLDSLDDAASLNVALYLLAELKISPFVIPKLLPLIDRERCEAVFQFQLDELLEKLEKGQGE